MKILVFAPHPDDEVLGCGGTIIKHSKMGDEIYLCIVTEAYTPDWPEKFIKERPKEIKKASEVLGIKKYFLLGLPTVKLDTIPQKELNEAILSIVKKIKPQMVYLPHGGDINKDHRLVFEAGMVALRPSNKTTVRKIFCYETLSETAEGRNLKEFSPNVFVDIKNEYQKKVKAMKIYKSELKKFPHPRSLAMMEIQAKSRGSEAGLKYAEAFMLVRAVK